ncbi:hypothetical protein [Streptomyces sp. NPDC046832]|uniref:hypothetical protein n=1 Tax=Streptomyces sp. NPDC046832 TaxID=3155020 RepID=UPI0033D07108
MLTLPRGSRVGALDDDPEETAVTAEELEWAGFTPIPLQPEPSIDLMLDQLHTMRLDALVCDHNLRLAADVDYWGAEVVCRANTQIGLVAVLNSAHVSAEQNKSIRRWRYGIPRVLKKSELSPEALSEALDETYREIRLGPPRSRLAFPAAVEVVAVHAGDFPTAEVIIGAWDASDAVEVPLAEIVDATGIRAEDLVGHWFTANVNCHAEHASQLFMTDIRPGATTADDWKRL